MKRYIGTALANVKPMTRLAYNQLRGWELPADENGDDEGYLVEKTNSTKANCENLGFKGYVSWLPTEQFNQEYESLDSMSFGLAIEALKSGQKVARAGWNGKGMWLEYVKVGEVQLHKDGFIPRNEHDHNWRERTPALLPWIGMKTADNKFVPWLASQTDILAEDWQIV